MTRSRKIETQLTADEKDLLRGLASARRELKAYEQQVEQAGITSKTAAQPTKGLRAETDGLAGSYVQLAAKAGVYIAVAEGVRRGISSVAHASSDLAESQNKANVVFGQASSKIADFAVNSDRDIGLSKRAAYEAAGAYGNMFRTIGLGDAPAAQMSVRLVQLAGDMASFNNQDPTEMLVKLRAGLAGEAEPLRTVGVLLSEARVKQEAYASGIAATGAELTEAQKVQARYQLILKDTTLQHGDFARTVGESLPNQERRFTAALDNFKVKIGQGLTDPMAKALETSTSLIGGIGQLIDMSAKPIAFTVQMVFDPGQFVQEKVGIPTGRDAQGRSWLGRTARDIEARLADPGIHSPQWGFAPSDIPLTKGSMWADDNFVPSGFTATPNAFMTQRDLDFKKMMEGSPERVAAMMKEASGLGLAASASGSGGVGASSARAAFGAGNLSKIAEIMGQAPGISSRATVAEFDAAVSKFKAIRAGLSTELAELGLTMADLSARGLENSTAFRDAEERTAALNDAQSRLQMVETLRLDSMRDSIEVTRENAKAIQAEVEAKRQERADLLQSAWRATNGGGGQFGAMALALAGANPGKSYSSTELAAQQKAFEAQSKFLGGAQSRSGTTPTELTVSLSSDLTIKGQP